MCVTVGWACLPVCARGCLCSRVCVCGCVCACIYLGKLGMAYRHVVGSLHLRILGERRVCAGARAGRGRARGRTRACSRSSLDDPLLNCVRVVPSRNFLAEVPGTVPAHTVSIVVLHYVFTAAASCGRWVQTVKQPSTCQPSSCAHTILSMYTFICTS